MGSPTARCGAGIGGTKSLAMTDCWTAGREGPVPSACRPLILQGIFSLALDNDLILKSPICKSYKLVYRQWKDPVWSSEQVQAILQAASVEHRAFFCCVGRTGPRLGELLGLQGKHIRNPPQNAFALARPFSLRLHFRRRDTAL